MLFVEYFVRRFSAFLAALQMTTETELRNESEERLLSLFLCLMASLDVLNAGKVVHDVV
jgi:hypothetical protein